jgi:tryptophan synthase alpha chain
VDGVIISDLPPEEGAAWTAAGKKHDVGTIFLVAPTSDEARLQSVARSASGFIYAVARLGVTGARDDAPPEIGELIARLKTITDTPVCAGFGFSSAPQIRATCASTDVDGIVAASALIDIFEKTAGDTKTKIAAAAARAREMKDATRA